MSSIKQYIANLRKEYASFELLKANILPDPIDQFERWFKEAMKAEVSDINIMMLATATKSGIPSCRTVLIKDYNHEGFTFYTNYNSRKGKELQENPFAALTFFWPELGRQIIIEGGVEQLDTNISVEYFNSRPEDSKIGALASQQSTVIKNRAVLEEKVSKLTKEYEGKDILKPDYWGGYLVRPTQIEFWQSRSNRLHDRILYVLEGNAWNISRLSP